MSYSHTPPCCSWHGVRSRVPTPEPGSYNRVVKGLGRLGTKARGMGLIYRSAWCGPSTSRAQARWCRSLTTRGYSSDPERGFCVLASEWRNMETKSLQSQQKPLSAAVLVAFFQGSEAVQTAEKVSALESSRLNYLIRHFEASDVSTVRTAVKDMKAQAEKDFGAKTPQHRTAGVRASEIQSLYGAWRFASLKPLEIKGGYHAVVDAARNTLKSQAIRWTGERIPEKWEKDVKKQVEQQADITLSVEMEREKFKRTHNGDEPTAEALAEVKQRTADAIRKNGAVSMARKLFDKQGPEFCSWLIEALENCIITAEAEATEQVQEKQEKAA